jgi:hypothetical protein
VALELLGLAPCMVMGVLGYALLVTGRKLRFGIPAGIREGWPLRVFGLVYLMAGLFFASRVIQGSFEPAALIATYLALAVGVLLSVDGWRRVRSQ